MNTFALGFAPITVPPNSAAFLTLNLYAIDEQATREAIALLNTSEEPAAIRAKAEAMPTEFLRGINRDRADLLELDARLIVANGMQAAAEQANNGTMVYFLNVYMRLVREAAERQQGTRSND